MPASGYLNPATLNENQVPAINTEDSEADKIIEDEEYDNADEDADNDGGGDEIDQAVDSISLNLDFVGNIPEDHILEPGELEWQSVIARAYEDKTLLGDSARLRNAIAIYLFPRGI